MTEQAVPPHHPHVADLYNRVPTKRLDEMRHRRPPQTKDEHVGFNGRVAVLITASVGTMWAAYIFAVIGITGIVAAVTNNATLVLLVGAVSGYFLQLVLLPVIIVGQNIQGSAADKRAIETYKDAEAILHECMQLQEHLQAQDKVLDHVVAHLAKVVNPGTA